MLNKILKLIKEKPKHYSKLIKNDDELKNWVIQHSSAKSDQFAVHIYSAVSNTTNVCQFNNIRRFKNIDNGWGFCGPASKCACAAISVSEKCSKAAASKDWASIVEKRQKTNLKKYGVKNAAQFESVKALHKKFYESADNVKLATDKYVQTMLEKYGVRNSTQVSAVKQKIKQTNLNRYGVDNPQKNKEINLRSQHTKKQRYSERHLIETSYERIKQKYHDLGYTLLTSQEDYTGVDQKNATKYQFNHDECGKQFETYIYSGHKPVCPECFYKHPSFVSRAETELADYIESLGIKPIRTERQLISPLHLDIYLPQHQLAIEYCGLYWHSQRANGKNPTYHKNKTELCAKKGVQLITIFEDEWVNKKELVKSVIKSRLGFSKKIGARSCKIQEISNFQAKAFIDRNHLQGNINATINFALLHNDQIISVMTFGQSRYNKSYQWEILRFCTEQDITVVGGAQKLFKHFIDQFQPASIISYCDLRWFTGATYEKLGMQLKYETAPNYWYTDYSMRYHRSNFTKKRLIAKGHSAELTESQIMENLNFDKIWDCGNKVFVKHLSKDNT